MKVLVKRSNAFGRVICVEPYDPENKQHYETLGWRQVLEVDELEFRRWQRILSEHRLLSDEVEKLWDYGDGDEEDWEEEEERG